MRRRQSVRSQFTRISIHATIRLVDWARRAAPVILLVGVLFAGAAVWFTASTRASHWAWKSWDRLFGPSSLSAGRPRVFALLGGNGNYTIRAVDETSAGTSAMEGTFVFAVNASGAMTGTYSNTAGVGHGFVYANGTFTSFDAPNAGLSQQSGYTQGTAGIGIDTAGDVVGIYADSGNAEHGFLRTASNGTITALDDPNVTTGASNRGTSAMAINNSGQIVGFYSTGTYQTTSTYGGFLYTVATGQFTNIVEPNAGSQEGSNGGKQGTLPLAINDSGTVTGYYIDSSNITHGFIYSAGNYTSIDVPGAVSVQHGGGIASGTVPMSIDAAGDVAGSWTDSTNVRHGFIRTASGTITVFDAPGATNSALSGTVSGTMATSIDPTGAYVAGMFSDSTGLTHGFVYYLPLTANATFTTFDAPNAVTAPTAFALSGTGGFSVNASGTAVGTYVDSSDVLHGFAYATTQIPTPTPTFNPGQGTYGAEQTVVISDANPSAAIYYTTDGTTPTINSTAYTAPITVPSTETVEAIAAASGYANSSVAMATYALSVPGGTPAPAPQFSPAGGTYSAAQPVTITDSATGALIYYTLDGSAPTDASTLYTAPVTISTSAELQAIAIVSNYAPSDITAASYQITGTTSPQFVYNVAGTGQPGYSGDGGLATQTDLGASDSATAVDSSGNVYIADGSNNRVRVVNATTGVISTYAGTGTAGYNGDGGLATAAELSDPQGLALDSSGNLYIADTGNGLIREVVKSTGDITTYAGLVSSGVPVHQCSTGANALDFPRGIAFDNSGNLYVADYACSVVWKVAAGSKTVTLFAGELNQHGNGGIGGTPTAFALNDPYSVAVDSSGNVYIADFENNLIREVVAGENLIETVAGNTSNNGTSGDGGSATQAWIGNPWAIAVDSAGDLYISGNGYQSIRYVSAQTHEISTIVGESSTQSNTLFANNDGALASENRVYPFSLTLGSNGALYFFDALGVRVRMVSAAAPAPTTAAATPVISLSSGSYSSPQTVTITDATPGASIYITLDGSTPTGHSPIYHGSVVVTGTSTLNAIAIAPGYVASAPASASYTITPAPSTLISTIATADTGGVSEEACFGGVALDSANDIYSIGSCEGYEGVFKISAGTGKPTLVAGTGATGYAGDGGQAAEAEFELTNFSGIALDSLGNIYVADTYNNRVRVINASTGVISTFAGDGTFGYSGDNGAATSAELAYPLGLAFDAQGNLYIADSDNDIVRVVNTQGIISTYAGTPQRGGYSGDNGLATSAYLESPQAITVDSAGNLYILDTGYRIREVVKSTGDITTIAGNGQYGVTGDGGPALSAPITTGFMATDTQHNVYVSNPGAGVREIYASGNTISTVVGDGYRGYWGDGGPPTNAGLASPYGLAFDSNGDLIIADLGNETFREVAPAIATPTFSPVAGSYTGTQQVSISDSTNGTTIYYTTNGDTPTTSSSIYKGQQIAVTSSETIQAIAAYGYVSSSLGSAAYAITSTAVTPTLTVSPGVTSISTTQSLQVTVTVSGGTGNPTPTGTVILSGGGYTSAATALTGGSVQITIPAGALTAKSYTFQAAYTPDTNSSTVYGTASGTATSSVAVSVAVPTVTVSPGATSITTLQSLQVTVAVSGGTGNPTPTGTVILSGGGYTSAATALTSGSVQITIPSGALTAKSYTFQAAYTADTNSSTVYGTASGTATSSVAVSVAVPTVTASPGATSITTLQSLQVTVAVSGGTGNPTPTGTVVLSGGGYTSAATTLSSGSVKITIPSGALTAKSYTFQAAYTADTNSSTVYGTASGTATSSVAVSVGTPTVTVSPGVTSISTTQSLQVTVAVSGGTGNPTPTGTVILSGGGYTSAATALTGGSVQITIPAGTLTVKSYTFQAAYTPDTTGATVYGTASGTATSSVAVTVATPTVTVTPGATSISTTQSLQVTIAVSGGTGNPTATGTVVLSGGGYTSAATALTGGSVQITIPAGDLTAGSDTLTATYTPDTNSSTTYSGATGSNSVTVTISNPTPVLTGISPGFGTAGGSAFSMTVSGTGFISGTTVYWGSTALTTTYVSATQLTAQVTAANIATAGTTAITVQTPTPGGGTSNTLNFAIDSGSSADGPTFTTLTATVTPGSSATYSVTLPSSATNVSVSCLNIPAGASCSYSASTGLVTITTSSTTPAGTYQITVVFTETLPGAATGLIFLPILLLPLAWARSRWMRQHNWITACLALVILAGTVSIGCGGSGGGSTTQTQTVTSAGTVTLIVQ